ncbi:hypothetical protein PoB_002099200 [Plakobranchus ocellatus]|uniref:Uncharacterized protein n=1 Tax=Plakobranchus ocellatus TaxID=259542 RepID=A0AAV3ZGQ1_9GAST|nr:hypothetical protein PoB_002099200 [Plakobranchus ocellatus]
MPCIVLHNDHLLQTVKTNDMAVGQRTRSHDLLELGKQNPAVVNTLVRVWCQSHFTLLQQNGGKKEKRNRIVFDMELLASS